MLGAVAVILIWAESVTGLLNLIKTCEIHD